MTWEDFALARKVLVEEHVGSPVREAKRAENRHAKRARSQVGRGAR